MKRKHQCLVGLAAGLVALAGSSGTAMADQPVNPAQLCEETNNLDGFLGSNGGCVSSVVTIGVGELMSGAFPSRPAAIANCKGIEDMVGGFPYYFYGQVGDDRYLATNLNSCVGVLFALHTGQIPPVGA